MTSKRRRLSYNARYSYEPIALLRQNATNHRRFYSTTTKNGLCSCGEVKRLSIGNWKKTKGDENMMFLEVSALIGHLKKSVKDQSKKVHLEVFGKERLSFFTSRAKNRHIPGRTTNAVLQSLCQLKLLTAMNVLGTRLSTSFAALPHGL
ncbi:uncharacterized protein [Oscarella lobularis]|uniref:uncharacterized protein isoform X1 n=1 Tax=Oscarella lobularis TaxID=121494 RepID=UPI00331310B0